MPLLEQSPSSNSSSSTPTPLPPSSVSPNTLVPSLSPKRPSSPPPKPPLAVIQPIQSTMQKSVGDSLLSLLGINQLNPSDTHDPHHVDLLHGGLVAPRLPPPEPYEFREMTLGCRFVTTDQWLTTRVDTSWKVSTVKLHMLTKLLGARRDQLKLLSRPPDSQSESTSSSHPPSTHDDKSIATSNQSSIIFALHEPSDLNHSPTPRYHPLPHPVERESFDSNSDIPSLTSFTQSVPTIYQPHLFSESDTSKPLDTHHHHLHHPSFGAATAPPAVIMDSSTVNVNKEDVLDELLDKLVKDAKECVHKVADQYCLMSFSCGNILDDSMTLTECRLRPFELLEMQEKSRFLRIPRRLYLNTYWESPVKFRIRGGGELQGIEGIKRLAKIEREEIEQQELQRDLVAVFVSNPANEARDDSKSAVTSAVLPWKDTPEARAREHEEKRRKLWQKAEREDAKKQKRETKEAAMERWKERLAIVEDHQLNLWKNRGDDYPEQSWDLRRVVEVSVPKRRKQPEFPPGSVAAAYAALKNSNALNVIRVKEKQKPDMEEEAKVKLPHHDLHIRFSIPLSSVNEALDPAGAAAKSAAKRKRELKKASKNPALHNSASSSKGTFHSSDPFNQGVGFGTSTLDGAGSATLVLRLPDERSLENLSRIIHRSAGKYPLNQKRKRGGYLSEGGRAQEVIHPDAVDATTSMITKQATKFHPYPEWRERMLQKCVVSGRHGFLTSPAWRAKLNPNTGVYELPQWLRKWRQDEQEEVEVEAKAKAEVEAEAEAEAEETLDEDESEQESLISDAEWEGWRRELELEAPIRPDSPALQFAQEGNPWTSESTQPSFVTESDGLRRGRRRKNTLVSGRDMVLEDIVKRTTEHSVPRYSVLQAQLSGASASSALLPSAGVVADTVSSFGARSGPADRRPFSSSNSVTTSLWQSSSVPVRARSATVSTPSIAPNPSSYNAVAIPLPNLPGALENVRLPGLGGGLSSARPGDTVTTISALRSADHEVPPKKGMARVWSNKGRRRGKADDNPTREDASIESQPLTIEPPSHAWTRSRDESLDRLRQMHSPGLRRSSSKGLLRKGFSLRDQ